MNKHRNRNIAVGTLVAAAAGYVAGILTAPKSGKETRKDIQKTALKAKKEAEKTLKKLHSELDVLLDTSSKKLKTLRDSAKKELDDAVSKGQLARDKARELLSALHDGDADDKDLQKAINDVTAAISHLKKFATKNAENKKR